MAASWTTQQRYSCAMSFHLLMWNVLLLILTLSLLFAYEPVCRCEWSASLNMSETTWPICWLMINLSSKCLSFIITNICGSLSQSMSLILRKHLWYTSFRGSEMSVVQASAPHGEVGNRVWQKRACVADGVFLCQYLLWGETNCQSRQSGTCEDMVQSRRTQWVRCRSCSEWCHAF